MQRLTDNDLNALEAALAKATPGEWSVRDHSKDEGCIYIEAPDDGVATVFTDCKAPLEENLATANAIALAHNALPALLAELRDLRRLATPEPVSEKHRDGNWWLVWEPGAEGWFKCRWRPVGDWQKSGTTQHLPGTPTHAVPLPAPPEPSAARGEE
jgi:hypothetical protein